MGERVDTFRIVGAVERATAVADEYIAKGRSIDDALAAAFCHLLGGLGQILDLDFRVPRHEPAEPSGPPVDVRRDEATECDGDGVLDPYGGEGHVKCRGCRRG